MVSAVVRWPEQVPSVNNRYGIPRPSNNVALFAEEAVLAAMFVRWR